MSAAIGKGLRRRQNQEALASIRNPCEELVGELRRCFHDISLAENFCSSNGYTLPRADHLTIVVPEASGHCTVNGEIWGIHD